MAWDKSWCSLGIFLALGCAETSVPLTGPPDGVVPPPDATTDTGMPPPGWGDAGSCEPPDMLIVLDRTQSMAWRPQGGTPQSHAESKWSIAVQAVEAVTTRLGATVRFGLELFPRDPGGDLCKTLADSIDGRDADNERCEGGEVPVTPALNAGVMIADTIDVEATRLCRSTPIGAALQTAKDHLASIRVAGRGQHILLVTDGEDRCDASPIRGLVQELAANDVKTWVIGFDASNGDDGIDVGMLNDIACAGHTAANFPASCTDEGGGNYARMPDSGPVFFHANSSDTLVTSLETATGEVCCGCLI